MTSTPKRLWRCGACDFAYTDELDAIECCAPRPASSWECPECKELHPKIELAKTCCSLRITCPNCMRIYDEESPEDANIEIAGHCSVCKPMFTADQKLQISDLQARS